MCTHLSSSGRTKCYIPGAITNQLPRTLPTIICSANVDLRFTYSHWSTATEGGHKSQLLQSQDDKYRFLKLNLLLARLIIEFEMSFFKACN